MRREEYISDEMVVKRVNEAVRIELEKKKAMDVPIVILGELLRQAQRGKPVRCL